MTEIDIETEERPNVHYGDVELAEQHQILRTVVGSGVHGIAIEGTDDQDEMGIFIEPMENVIGTAGTMDVVTYRTKPEGVRSEPGDLDLSLYALRKYIYLAAKGNPTMLLPMFAPLSSVVQLTALGADLRAMRHAFLSKQAVERSLRYMYSQHEAMMGRGRRNRTPYRPELIEQFGYDVKFGSHALRLAYQGYEICLTGTLTLPLPEDPREQVLAVKRGEMSRIEVSRLILSLTKTTKQVMENGSPLPDKPDWQTIGEFSTRAHLMHWQVV